MPLIYPDTPIIRNTKISASFTIPLLFKKPLKKFTYRAIPYNLENLADLIKKITKDYIKNISKRIGEIDDIKFINQKNRYIDFTFG